MSDVTLQPGLIDHAGMRQTRDSGQWRCRNYPRNRLRATCERVMSVFRHSWIRSSELMEIQKGNGDDLLHFVVHPLGLVLCLRGGSFWVQGYKGLLDNSKWLTSKLLRLFLKELISSAVKAIIREKFLIRGTNSALLNLFERYLETNQLKKGEVCHGRFS